MLAARQLHLEGNAITHITIDDITLRTIMPQFEREQAWPNAHHMRIWQKPGRTPRGQRTVIRRTAVKLMLSAAAVDWITAGSQTYSPGLTTRAK